MSIWVGRYSIVGGEVREHGPWLVDRLRTRDDERVRILVLAEPVDERSGEFCAEVAAAVAGAVGRQQVGMASVLGYRLAAGKTFVTNNVPYVLQLNDGSSTKAPAGFVQLAVVKAAEQSLGGITG